MYTQVIIEVILKQECLFYQNIYMYILFLSYFIFVEPL